MLSLLIVCVRRVGDKHEKDKKIVDFRTNRKKKKNRFFFQKSTFGLDSFFNDLSNFVGYLMLKPSL